MVKKIKKQKITLKSIIRLIIFIALVFFLINFFDKNKDNPNLVADPTSYVGESLGGQILGTIYPKLPEDSRHQLEHFDQTTLGKFLSNSSAFVNEQLNGFPQRQIKELKKDLIKKISDDLIKDIDNQ